MVFDQNTQIFHTIYHNAEIIDQIFTIEKVVGREQKVPGQAAEPWQTMNTIHLVANRDDLFEAFHLNQQGLQIKKFQKKNVT